MVGKMVEMMETMLRGVGARLAGWWLVDGIEGYSWKLARASALSGLVGTLTGWTKRGIE